MMMENYSTLKSAKLQQLVNDSSSRICYIPAKIDHSVNSFSTVVLDGTVRDFIVCNQCSVTIPWESQGDNSKVNHDCEEKEAIQRKSASDFLVEVSPRSSPEMKVGEGRSGSCFSQEEIKALIDESSDRVRLLPKKGKSLVWKLFSLVEVDGIPQEYVFCNHCNLVTRWKAKAGTNNLRIHVYERHSAMPPDISISELVSETSSLNTSNKGAPFLTTQVVNDSPIDGTKQLSKRELQGLIDSCSSRVSFLPGKGKSQVWVRFYLVKVDGEITNFAMCKECRAAIIWKSKDGTNGLRNHSCKTSKISKKMRLSELTQDSPPTSSLHVENNKDENDCQGSVPPPTKEEVQALVDESSERVCLIPGRGKSDVWLTFSFVEVDGRKMELALCNLCNSVVTWKSKDGTNGLRKHSCKQIRLLQSPVDSPKPMLKSPLMEEAELVDRAAAMCAMDLIPIDIISGSGFLNLIQYVYSLGAHHGSSSDIKEMLPSEKLVAKRLDEMAVVERQNLMTELHVCSSFGVAVDLWHHNALSQDFFTVTIHYMVETDESLIIRNRVIFSGELGLMNGEALREKIMNVLQEFGVYRKNVYITGDDQVVTQAFNREKRLLCAGSGIHLTLRTAFDDLKYDECPRVVNLLQACKSLVSFVKDERIQKHLSEDEIPLQDYNPRHWNSLYHLLLSVLNAMPKLGELLTDLNELGLLYDIDCSLLEEMVKLLKPFNEATKLLAWSNSPTLPLVIPTKVKLKRCLEDKEDDSELIKQIKLKLKHALDENFQIDVVHCVATILHPKMKGFVKQYLGEETFEATKKQITCISNNINGLHLKKDQQQQVEKKHEIEKDQSEFLSEVISDCTTQESDGDEDELSFYLESKHSTRFGDPLFYWKQNASLFPNLCKVAKSVLAVPASGVPCEIYSSAFGRQMEARKSYLNADSINNLLLVHSAMKQK